MAILENFSTYTKIMGNHSKLYISLLETSGKLPFRISLLPIDGVMNQSCVCNLSTKEHKSKSAAITQTGNRVQDLAGVRNETKSLESKVGKAQVSICGVCRSNWWSCI